MGAILGQLFGSLYTFFALYVGKKLATVAIIIAVFSASWLLLVAARAALIASLGSLDYGLLSDFIGCGMPSNTETCISAIFTSWSVRTGYEWYMTTLNYQKHYIT